MINTSSIRKLLAPTALRAIPLAILLCLPCHGWEYHYGYPFSYWVTACSSENPKLVRQARLVMRHICKSATHPEVRLQAMQLLLQRETADVDMIEFLFIKLSDIDKRIRFLAMRGLEDCRLPGSVLRDPVSIGFQDPSPAVRWAALRVSASASSIDLHLLANASALLNDTNTYVQSESVLIIRRLASTHPHVIINLLFVFLFENRWDMVRCYVIDNNLLSPTIRKLLFSPFHFLREPQPLPAPQRT